MKLFFFISLIKTTNINILIVLIIFVQIIWEPYTTQVRRLLPDYVIQGEDNWRSVVPLICFHLVEWHHPDRVMPQFGMTQHVPMEPSQPQQLHDITLRGKFTENWQVIHAPYIALWNNRQTYVVTTQEQRVSLSSNSQYMRWYNLITRRWISRDGAQRASQVNFSSLKAPILLPK